MRSYELGKRLCTTHLPPLDWYTLQVFLPPNSLRRFLICQGGEFQIEQTDGQEWCFVRGPVRFWGLMPLPKYVWGRKVGNPTSASTMVGGAGVSAVSSPPGLKVPAFPRSIMAFPDAAADAATVYIGPGGQPSYSTPHLGIPAEGASQTGAAGQSVGAATSGSPHQPSGPRSKPPPPVFQLPVRQAHE